jgi:hypothetical protein
MSPGSGFRSSALRVTRPCAGAARSRESAFLGGGHAPEWHPSRLMRARALLSLTSAAYCARGDAGPPVSNRGCSCGLAAEYYRKPQPETRSMKERETYPAARILVVDDHSPNLLAMCAVLEELGHEIVCARSCKETLRLTADFTFAVILLDVQLGLSRNVRCAQPIPHPRLELERGRYSSEGKRRPGEKAFGRHHPGHLLRSSRPTCGRGRHPPQSGHDPFAAVCRLANDLFTTTSGTARSFMRHSDPSGCSSYQSTGIYRSAGTREADVGSPSSDQQDKVGEGAQSLRILDLASNSQGSPVPGGTSPVVSAHREGLDQIHVFRSVFANEQRTRSRLSSRFCSCTRTVAHMQKFLRHGSIATIMR